MISTALYVLFYNQKKFILIFKFIKCLLLKLIYYSNKHFKFYYNQVYNSHQIKKILYFNVTYIFITTSSNLLFV